jgi:hypothetical protein
MRFPQILLIALFSAWGSAQADETSFCGRSLGQKVIEYLELPCPKDLACFGVWIRREMQIDRLLSGPAVGNRITVARIQHGLFNPEFDASFSLFTVRPIDEKAKRDLLGADFVLVKSTNGEEAQACINSPGRGATYG